MPSVRENRTLSRIVGSELNDGQFDSGHWQLDSPGACREPQAVARGDAPYGVVPSCIAPAGSELQIAFPGSLG
jgi:hypothetical protein